MTCSECIFLKGTGENKYCVLLSTSFAASEELDEDSKLERLVAAQEECASACGEDYEGGILYIYKPEIFACVQGAKRKNHGG